MLFRFRRFQSRLMFFFLSLLVVVLAAVYLSVDRENAENALAIIDSDLLISADNFEATIARRNESLAIAGDALSSDFAFKQAHNTDDHQTILSAMENLMGRLIDADFIVMVEEQDDTVIADTRQTTAQGQVPSWRYLIDSARELYRQGEYPEAADVVILDGRPYHLSVLPFYNPDIEAWIALGFEIGEAFTRDFKSTIAAEVTVLVEDGAGRWNTSGSTLPPAAVAALLADFDSMSLDRRESRITSLAGDDYVTLSIPIMRDANTVQVLLQRSLSALLAPYEELKAALLTIFALGLAALMMGVVMISRKVTSPVHKLAEGARRIEGGNYAQRVEIPLQDEIGELAEAFNAMARGLLEKEKVRNLLGKVVSREIANELMSRELELGGEECRVTILFADVRGFTALCEGRSPKEILTLLNDYFSSISTLIEGHGGVVDKYIGDAVMALFGAPVRYEDAASRAVRTALAMSEALAAINAGFIRKGAPPIRIGIGVNTDDVVVGNMGSRSRLNYTVIGDGVNLASRLEGLTKWYGSDIVLSASTCLAAPEFAYQELDLVRVQGKQEPVRIFRPLGEKSALDEATRRRLAPWTRFLQAYRQGDFDQASGLLDDCAALAAEQDNVLISLYRQRVAACLQSPPLTWEGVHSYAEK